MLLETLRADGLLSFAPGSREILLRPLNVIIGPNGSGKSNLIEILSTGSVSAEALAYRAELRSRLLGDGVHRPQHRGHRRANRAAQLEWEPALKRSLELLECRVRAPCKARLRGERREQRCRGLFRTLRNAACRASLGRSGLPSALTAKPCSRSHSRTEVCRPAQPIT